MCTLLRAHASQTSTKRSGDSAQAQRKGAQRPACVHPSLCARALLQRLEGTVLKPQTIFDYLKQYCYFLNENFTLRIFI